MESRRLLERIRYSGCPLYVGLAIRRFAIRRVEIGKNQAYRCSLCVAFSRYVARRNTSVAFGAFFLVQYRDRSNAFVGLHKDPGSSASNERLAPASDSDSDCYFFFIFSLWYCVEIRI